MNFAKLFDGLTVDDHAKTAQTQCVEYLCSNGFDCKTEVVVDSRYDGTDRNGRIDIVANKDGKVIGIEFDKAIPRKKSIEKLKHFECDHRIVLLRHGNKHYKIDNIEVLSIKGR